MNYLEELKRLDQEEMLDKYQTSQSSHLSTAEVLRGCQREVMALLIIESGKIRLESTANTIYVLRVQLLPAVMYMFQLLEVRNTISKIFGECEALFKRKNADYGNAFVDFGAVGVLIRLNDKFNRAVTLSKGKQEVADESLIDTLLDAVNYIIMADILLSE